MILAGVFYLLLKRCLFRWLSIQEEVDFEAHQRAAKLYFGFLAFFIWGAIGQTVELLPKDPNYKHIPKNTLLEGLIVFGSIPLAIWFYKIAIKLYVKKPSVEMSAKDHAQQNMDLM